MMTVMMVMMIIFRHILHILLLLLQTLALTDLKTTIQDILLSLLLLNHPKLRHL